MVMQMMFAGKALCVSCLGWLVQRTVELSSPLGIQMDCYSDDKQRKALGSSYISNASSVRSSFLLTVE